MAMSSEVMGDGRRRALALQLLDLVRDFVLMSGRSIAGTGDAMKKDCTDLIRRIALLIHLAEEITNFCSGSGDNFEKSNDDGSSTSLSSWLDCLSEVVGAIQAAKRLLYTALTFSAYDEEGCAPSTVSSSCLSIKDYICLCYFHWCNKSAVLSFWFSADLAKFSIPFYVLPSSSSLYLLFMFLFFKIGESSSLILFCKRIQLSSFLSLIGGNLVLLACLSIFIFKFYIWKFFILV